MANPIVTSTEFVGSKEEARNGYGQNGYQGASSVLPGKAQPKLGNPKVAPPSSVLPDHRGHDVQDALAHRVHTTDGKPTQYEPHSAMLHTRTTDHGSPGGKVPEANLRRDSGKNLLK
jgi:hypothetical protein